MSSGLSELELLNIDEKTLKPVVGSRLKDVKSADSIYQTLKQADEKSSTNRARIQAIFDGAPPFDSALLRSTGQAQRTNLNFGEANRYLDVAVAGYVDLINAVETLVDVTVDAGSETEKPFYESVISEELSRTIRDWPEFHTSYLRLATEFIIHGVSAAIFRDDRDFRFRVTGFQNFWIPRQTPASEAAVEVACYRDGDLLLHELWSSVKEEAVAEESGWNVAEAKRVMLKASTRESSKQTNWEQLQAELKNNDLFCGTRANSVPVIHTYVREFDGSVSHFIHAENAPLDFLYVSVGRFLSPEQTYLLFTNGVGSNGTYHSVRGLGQKIFAHVQVSNRLRSQAVDGAMLASSVMIQPDSQRALDELSLTYYGPYTVLSPNIQLTEKATPNLSNSVVPLIADLSAQMEKNLDFFSNSGAAGGSQYRTKLQVEAELEVATRLTASNLNLFYNSWRRLMREIVRRIVLGNKSDAAVKDFFKRCAERDVDSKVINSIDFAKTKAVKAIGAGNASARTAALNDLEGLMPFFNEAGKKNLIFDRVAARAGYEVARRYASPADEQQPTYDSKMAKLENAIMRLSQPVEVSDTDMHATHLTEQVPDVQEILAGLEAGQLDGQAILPVLSLLHEHIAKHTEYLSADPSAQSEAAQYRELVANSQAVIMNLQRQAQKLEREKSDQPELAEGEVDPKQRLQELKLQEIAQRIELARINGETTRNLKQQKFEQEMALADVKTRNSLAA